MEEREDPIVGRVVLGRFRVVRQLARGGMGVIYLARAEGADGFVRPVVVKRIAPHYLADEKMVKSFAREARIMSNLRHAGIVGVLDFGREGGDSFMVLEYVRGHHLGRWLHFVQTRHGPFPVQRALHIVLRVLDALQYAHTLVGPDGVPAPIIHRDVTPQNVLIDVDGPVKLADFGIAKMQTDSSDATGADLNVRGKMAYLAPELLRFEPPGPATDTYSAAVVLHELLVGHNEMRGASPEATVARVIEHVPSRVDNLRKDAPRALGLVLARALAKEPHVRFQTADQLAQALRALRLEDPHEAAAELQRAATADFREPQFMQLTGAEDLVALDRAWREAVSVSLSVAAESEPTADAPGLGPSSSPPPRSASGAIRRPSGAMLAPELLPDGDGVGVMAAPRRIPTWLRIGAPLAAVAAVAGAVGATVAVLVESGTPENGPSYVLVSGDVEAVSGTPAILEDAGAPSVVEPADAGPGTVDAAAGSPGAVQPDAGGRVGPSPVNRPRPTAEALSRTFARQRSIIARCIQTHVPHDEPVPELSVRFQVDASGHVQSAELLPAALGGSPLGQCVLGIARRTSFGPIGEPITFRIPVSARRRGRTP